jgi:hypothetical protein
MGFAVVLAAIASAAQAGVRDPVDLFIDACVRGELRIPRGSADVRIEHDSDGSTRVFRIDPDGAALLRIKTFSRPERRGIETTCTLSSSKIAYADAVTRLSAVVSPDLKLPPVAQNQTKYELYAPHSHYRAEVWREAGGVVMRTTVLAPQAAAAEEAKLEKEAQKYLQRHLRDRTKK